jgi:hypothetical protein
VSRWTCHGALAAGGTALDIGSGLLAMDGSEARALARRFELDLPDDAAQRLVAQTAMACPAWR